jgi:GH15 family glucan-1,4-alpha-glucosidase
MYAPSGGMVAALTTSLPETPGGERNWDYRYTWIRDATFALWGLHVLGLDDEARDFMDFVERVTADGDGHLQIMYGIGGEKELTESTLDHLNGYLGSRPVRIGNAAYSQRQNDVYGALLDSIYIHSRALGGVSDGLWKIACSQVEAAIAVWEQPDQGIWEARGEPKHYLSSKLMCWVALDRGLRLADKRSFPADRSRWRENRDAIYEEIMARGWSRERQAFVQAFDGHGLDAANLIMPLVFFVSPTDPRFLQTLDATVRDLTHGSLVHRYDVKESPDGLEGEEGTFSMCTFWLVEALTRAGRLEEARLLFEKMLGYANHLGLYSEQVGLSGEALGNFPQAFTHLSLISAAFNLDRRLGRAG